MHRKSVIALRAMLALYVAPALAGERVGFSRAKLDDPVYVAELHDKIEAAARKECKALLAGSYFYQEYMDGCIEDTVAAAIAEIDAPALTTYAAAA